MAKKNLKERVDEESTIYDNHLDGAVDHLYMAQSHLFEIFEGRDVDDLLSDIDSLIARIWIMQKGE